MGFMQELFEINVLIIYLINSENYEINSVMMWTYEILYCIWNLFNYCDMELCMSLYFD